MQTSVPSGRHTEREQGEDGENVQWVTTKGEEKSKHKLCPQNFM